MTENTEKLSQEALSLIWGLVVGHRSFLTDEELEKFKDLGVPEEFISAHLERRDNASIYVQCSGIDEWIIPSIDTKVLIEIINFCDLNPEEPRQKPRRFAEEVLKERFFNNKEGLIKRCFNKAH